ncbi:MAG: fibronectin type III domain-containing protein [Candidatus Absconditabacterales bacterium]|nr:fibronectin type III domain-containing protein [Candidatus Absconditabacterales bacterium]
MKRFIIFILVLCVLSTGLVMAQTDINAFLQEILSSIGTSSSFGFGASDTVTVVRQTDTSVEISFPVVMSGSTPITRYKVDGYNVSMQNVDNIDLVDSSLTVSQDSTIPQDQVTARVGRILVTGLNPGTTYYFTVTPRGPNGENGTPSREVVYNPATATTQMPSNTGITNQQGSAANMNLANVTYTTNGLAVTMRRTPIGGATKIQFSYTTPGVTVAQVLGVANMADGTFTFTVPRPDTYIVNLQPLRDDNAQAGTAIAQTIRVLAGGASVTPTNPGTPIPVVPNVGPKEDVMMLLFLSVLVYVGYQGYRKIRA